jgi:hypothetical protein
MTDEQSGKSMEMDLQHKWRERFGLPPVLSTENIEAYNEMMSQFVAVFAPQNFLEQSFIRTSPTQPGRSSATPATRLW